MKKVQKKFIIIHILLVVSFVLFISFKYFKVRDLSKLFIIKNNRKSFSLFVIENGSLLKKDFDIKSRNERENIEEALSILKKNHQEVLGLDYLIRNVYMDDNIYISIKIEKNNLNEVNEALFIYSIINSINSEKKVKFINLNKGKLFNFMDEDTFFQTNKAFGEL